MKKKVLVVSGSRAEFSLLESTIYSLKRSRKLSPLVLVTGMHTLNKFGYTLNDVRKKVEVASVVPLSQSGNMLSWLSEEISGIAKYVEKNRPDCVLVLGDRDEPLAAVLVAAHFGIPIAHIHGGDLSGESVIDTKNRNVITQYSTFHFPATNKSGRRVEKIIGSSKNVNVVGAPGVDLLKSYGTHKKPIVAKKFKLDPLKKWLLIILHPVWIGEIFFDRQINSVTDAIGNFDGEIIWIYPNSDEGSDVFIEKIKKFSKTNKCKVFKNLPREDFINFMANVDVMVGNSSSGIIESTYFHLPVVNIGSRQKGRERSSNIIDCGYNSAKIKKSIQRATEADFKKRSFMAKLIYGDGNAGEKISSILDKIL